MTIYFQREMSDQSIYQVRHIPHISSSKNIKTS